MSDVPPPTPPRISAREIIAIILVLLGAIAVVVGVSLYDWRAGLAVGGGLVLAIGVLLGIG